MNNRKYRVLSIDAKWEGDGWSWNNWSHIDSLDALPDDDKAIDALIEIGVLGEKARELARVEDDQYNLVVVDKRDDCPLYAIEYGNAEDDAEVANETHNDRKHGYE